MHSLPKNITEDLHGHIGKARFFLPRSSSLFNFSYLFIDLLYGILFYFYKQDHLQILMTQRRLSSYQPPQQIYLSWLSYHYLRTVHSYLMRIYDNSSCCSPLHFLPLVRYIKHTQIFLLFHLIIPFFNIAILFYFTIISTQFVLKVLGKLALDMETLNKKILFVEKTAPTQPAPIIVDVSFERLMLLTRLPDSCLLTGRIYPCIKYVLFYWLFEVIFLINFFF